jgi:YD repeat-containing protein
LSDSEGFLAHYTYDANSNRLSEKDANNHISYSAYDSLNRIKMVTDAMGQSSYYFYDKNSNLDSLKDRNNHVTVFKYDSLNRKIQTTYPLGNKVYTIYDSVGNTKQMIDDSLHATTYVYDANNRLIKEIYADNSMKQFTYDSLGNMISRIDNNGDTTFYIYDSLNRLLLRNYPLANDDTMTYDYEGNLLTAINSNAIITYSYDSVYRVKSENMNNKITQFSYDMANNKRTIQYPSNRTIIESYDKRTRLSNIYEGLDTLTHFVYDTANRLLSRKFRNGVLSTYDYNANDWVTNLSHKHNSDTLAIFDYDFDHEGNRLTVDKKT